MNLTLKIINGNRTSFHPVGSSPSVYRQPADADGRVAKVYDTREENMHEIFKGDEAYLINGYGKTIDIVYRPEQFGVTRGSTWSDEAIARLLKDARLDAGLCVDKNDHSSITEPGTGEMTEQQVMASVNSAIANPHKANCRTETPASIFHALKKGWIGR